jgi:tRNA-splicing ligase RtcB
MKRKGRHADRRGPLGGGEGWGDPRDLERIEEGGRMTGAIPECISERARERQRSEMGTLGSGNH